MCTPVVLELLKTNKAEFQSEKWSRHANALPNCGDPQRPLCPILRERGNTHTPILLPIDLPFSGSELTGHKRACGGASSNQTKPDSRPEKGSTCARAEFKCEGTETGSENPGRGRAAAPRRRGQRRRGRGQRSRRGGGAAGPGSGCGGSTTTARTGGCRGGMAPLTQYLPLALPWRFQCTRKLFKNKTQIDSSGQTKCG